MELYHYRSVDTALKEIENRTFHYSDRTELNDPIEGYVQIYWQGDVPAWEGLFRNYICSLFHGIELYLLKGKYIEIEKHAVLLDIHHFDNLPLGEIYKTVSDRFTENKNVQKVIKCLVDQNIRCSVKLLRLLLRIVHEIAFSVCIKCMKEKRLIPDEQEENYIPIEDIIDKFPTDILKQMAEVDRKVLFEVSIELFEDMIESRFLTLNLEEQHQTWLKLRVDFPSIYTSQIQEIIYPKGYVVCFSSDNANSAMWGNYADNHKGVCLVYQTTTVKGRETLSVRSQVALRSQGVSFSYRNDEIRPVKYDNPMIQRNFFESLGRLTYCQVSSWLETGTGEKSEILTKYDEEEWRKKYRTDFEEKYYLKLPEWKHEKEHRLLLINFIHQYTEKERLIEYAKNDFIGVIFGIKTTLYDKQQIVSAIKKSGMNLKDIKFYQAEYVDEMQKIKIREKNLLLE